VWRAVVTRAFESSSRKRAKLTNQIEHCVQSGSVLRERCASCSALRMLTFRGLLLCSLVGLSLISSACAKRCRAGAVLTNGRCVLRTASGGDGAQAGIGGATGELSQGEVAAGTSGQTDSRPARMQERGSAGGRDGVDTTIAAAGNGGPSISGDPTVLCTSPNLLRCSTDTASAQFIEICADGKWQQSRGCTSDETCMKDANGAVACVSLASAPSGCIGLTCNGACVPDDEKNCGSCGHDCTQLAHVSGPTVCTAGVCSFEESSCEPGFAHCSAEPEDGCETSLSDPSNCGACGIQCPATEPVCALPPGGTASSPSYACSTGCTQDAPALCGMSCIDVMTNAAHCGACDNACPSVTNGQAVCEDGNCAKRCNANHHLCGDDCVSDRDPKNCGSSCDACTAPTGAQATCDGRTCGFACTNARALKCADGCYPSDDRNCGVCGNDCATTGSHCDGLRCVECRSNSDCGGAERYCVANRCRQCQPGDASACGECQQCSSSGTCMSSGSNKTCYRDADGDGYGAESSSMTVCGACPSGYIERGGDCYDSSAEVHPGQTKYFETGHGGGTFDYDCDGQQEPQYPEWKIENCGCVSSVCTAVIVSNVVPCGARAVQCSGAGSMCSACLNSTGYPQPCR
jgi:hypothetical protein